MPVHFQHKCRFQENMLGMGVEVHILPGARHGSHEFKASLQSLFKDYFTFEIMYVGLPMCGDMPVPVRLTEKVRRVEPLGCSCRPLWATWHGAESQTSALCESNVLLEWLIQFSTSPESASQGVWSQFGPREVLSKKTKQSKAKEQRNQKN